MIALPLLITPLLLDITMLILGLVGVAVLLGFLYRFVLFPAFEAMADSSSPPPAIGESREILLTNGRRLRYRVGLVDSDWKLRMKGIVEDHLVLDFKKDRNLEEYEIDIHPNGALFYRAPHEQHLTRIKGRTSMESRELIGHPALFRLGAAMQGDRPINYVEFELSTRFVIDNSGDERMKFIVELKRIHPGIDMKSRSKRGIYNFGRGPGASDNVPPEE